MLPTTVTTVSMVADWSLQQLPEHIQAQPWNQFLTAIGIWVFTIAKGAKLSNLLHYMLSPFFNKASLARRKW